MPAPWDAYPGGELEDPSIDMFPDGLLFLGPTPDHTSQPDVVNPMPPAQWLNPRPLQNDFIPIFNKVEEIEENEENENHGVLLSNGHSNHSLASISSVFSRDSGISMRGPVRDHGPEVIDYTPELTPSSGRYSCPYRKINPSNFNVCDFPKCALESFDTVSEVKQHVLRYHQSKDLPFQCRVCTSRFRKRKDLDNHFNTQLCHKPPTLNDHENGIDDAMLAILKERRQASRVHTWEDLWNVIFPGCDIMAPGFIPPRLAQEQTDASTQTSPKDPDQKTAESESQPSSYLHPQQGTPDSQAQPIIHPKITMPRTSTSLRQVGLARVHIEILSLSEQHRQWGHDETGSLDGFDSETDGEGSDDDASSPDAHDSDGSPGDASTGTPSTVGNASQGQTFVSATGQPRSSRKRNRANEGEGDDNGNKPPEKKQRRQSRDVDPSRRRFACPYQASGLSDNCFRRAQRNKTGGCDTISRLKDHLKRKHMKSYRCDRCWKQFDARHEALAHPESNCPPEEMPEHEQFMTQEQEIEVRNFKGNSEGTWWRLFHLLIPDMVPIEERASFQLHYSHLPYYLHLGSFLIIPPVHLENPSFQNTDSLSPYQTNRIGSALTPLGSRPDTFTGFGSTRITSQSFTTPIYGAATQQPSSNPSFLGLDQAATAFPDTQRSVESSSTGSSDRINASSTPASSLNVIASPALDTSQMQRNYERQKTRAEQAEGENGELRATISASREQLRDASMLLEGVLGRENLDREVCEQLNRAAEILLRVTGRLR